MKFTDFIEEGKVKNAIKDTALAKSLVITAESDMQFLRITEINDISARKIMANYYDILRSIVEAISIL